MRTEANLLVQVNSISPAGSTPIIGIDLGNNSVTLAGMLPGQSIELLNIPALCRFTMQAVVRYDRDNHQLIGGDLDLDEMEDPAVLPQNALDLLLRHGSWRIGDRRFGSSQLLKALFDPLRETITGYFAETPRIIWVVPLSASRARYKRLMEEVSGNAWLFDADMDILTEPEAALLMFANEHKHLSRVSNILYIHCGRRTCELSLWRLDKTENAVRLDLLSRSSVFSISGEEIEQRLLGHLIEEGNLIWDTSQKESTDAFLLREFVRLLILRLNKNRTVPYLTVPKALRKIISLPKQRVVAIQQGTLEALIEVEEFEEAIRAMARVLEFRGETLDYLIPAGEISGIPAIQHAIERACPNDAVVMKERELAARGGVLYGDIRYGRAEARAVRSYEGVLSGSLGLALADGTLDALMNVDELTAWEVVRAYRLEPQIAPSNPKVVLFEGYHRAKVVGEALCEIPLTGFTIPADNVLNVALQRLETDRYLCRIWHTDQEWRQEFTRTSPTH